MRTKISAKGHGVPLNPFISELIANVIMGIISSLKIEDKEIEIVEIHLQEQQITRLEINGKPVSLELTTGFARKIVTSTLTGMLKPLKEAGAAKDVLIEIEKEVI